MLDRASTLRTAERREIFISYSHRDAAWLERLRVHLEPLVNRDRLQVWDDGSIEPGERWLDELRTRSAVPAWRSSSSALTTWPHGSSRVRS